MVDSDMLKYCLQSLEELVEDENKILTYSWIANTFSISVNVAKHLLELHVKRHKNEKLQVTYCLAGIQKDTGSIIMDVVKCELISDWMANISSLISSHIYSVGKSINHNVDIKSLHLAESYDNYSSQKSVVTSDEIQKVSEEALLNLREMAYKKMSGSNPKQSAIKHKSTEQSRDGQVKKSRHEEENGITLAINGKKYENQNADEIINKNVKKTGGVHRKEETNKCPDKKNSITSMFATQSNHKTNNIVANTIDKISQKPKGIQGFFQKESKKSGDKVHNVEVPGQKCSKIAVEQSAEVEIKNEKNVEIGVIKKEKSDIFYKKDDQITNTSAFKPKETLKLEVSSKPKPAGKSVPKKNKKSTELKKRKRVICMSDSDSDDQDVKLELSKDPFEDNNIPEEHISSEDEIIPPTPQINSGRVKTLNNNALNPRKKRKVIDKTYTDEDGYILTKKEIVYESCSENEETAPESDNKPVKNQLSPKKLNIVVEKSVNGNNLPKGKSKTIAPPRGKNKQATLSNFFKKA